MTLFNRINRWALAVVSAAIASAVVVAVWTLWLGPQTSADRDDEVATALEEEIVEEEIVEEEVKSEFSLAVTSYGTIGGILDAAEAVAVVKVGRVAQTGIDRGPPADVPFADFQPIAIPYKMLELDVLETIKGKLAAAIFLMRPDPGAYGSEVPLSKFRMGDTLLLFLRKSTVELSPTVKVTDEFYLTKSADNGVFDVKVPSGHIAGAALSGDTVLTARDSNSSRAFAAGAAFRLQDVRDAATAAGDSR